jgi:hypothetical protein
MTAARIFTITELILLTSCCPSPRFTHVDVGAGPLPFVFFDQKTRQLCWADNETAHGNLVSVTIAGPINSRVVEMPVCKDLK